MYSLSAWVACRTIASFNSAFLVFTDFVSSRRFLRSSSFNSSILRNRLSMSAVWDKARCLTASSFFSASPQNFATTCALEKSWSVSSSVLIERIKTRASYRYSARLVPRTSPTSSTLSSGRGVMSDRDTIIATTAADQFSIVR